MRYANRDTHSHIGSSGKPRQGCPSAKRRQKLAEWTARRRKGRIEGRERLTQTLCNCYVPGVVARDSMPQLPDARGERREREQSELEFHEVFLRSVRLWSRDLLSPLKTAQDIHYLGRRELRSVERPTAGEDAFRPSALLARIDEHRDEHGRIYDDIQRRSESRSLKICRAETRVCDARFLLRTCVNTSRCTSCPSLSERHRMRSVGGRAG